LKGECNFLRIQCYAKRDRKEKREEAESFFQKTILNILWEISNRRKENFS